MITLNALKAGFVEKRQYYLFSSARNYKGMSGLDKCNNAQPADYNYLTEQRHKYKHTRPMLFIPYAVFGIPFDLSASTPALYEATHLFHSKVPYYFLLLLVEVLQICLQTLHSEERSLP